MAILLVVIIAVSVQLIAFASFERLFSQNSVSRSSGSHGGNGSGNGSGTANTIKTNTLLNYGNGTARWFNESNVPVGWNFYNLTLFLTDGRVHSLAFPDLQNEHQVLGISGIEQNSTDYWSLWKYCPSYNAWAWSPVGADRILLSNNGVYGWYYQNQNTHYAPVSGAATVTILDISSC